jgi:hypothetical protein
LCNISDEKCQGIRSSGSAKHRPKCNIKTDLNEIGCKVVEGIVLSQIETCHEFSDQASVSMKGIS